MKRNHRNHNGLNFWPSFTDAITAIFICVTFFLVVMVIKNYVDLSRLRTLEELVGKIEKDLDELEEFMGGEDVVVEEGTIVMRSDILFSFDESDLDDIPVEGQNRLRRIGQKLKQFIEKKDSKLFSIVVEGHTDSYGKREYNRSLSLKRSQTVVDYWEQTGFTWENFDIVPVGLGDRELIVLTGTKDEQSPNRRIVIRLVPKFNQLIQSLKEQNILLSVTIQRSPDVHFWFF